MGIGIQTRWAALVVALALAVAVSSAGGEAGTGDVPKGIVHRLPATGRTYELLVPPAAAAEMKDLPLVVYLHPSGKPQLERAKRDYWPLLAKRKCLLALPRSRSTRMWLSGEDKYVLDVIADVQTRYSVDAKRIILLGVSGGGQTALFLADHLPERFRALILVSTSPVVIRGQRFTWFYPNRKVLKRCPYFVVNHITLGSSLMYWRQVQAKLNPAGASISILPVTGKVEDYQPPPKALGPWLDEVLAGKHPTPLPDPQKLAVARMFAKVVSALPAAIAKAVPAGTGRQFTKAGKVLTLSVAAPAGFERTPSREAEKDSTGAALTQLRLEHAKWPIAIRCDARATARPMSAVLAQEEQATIARGMLYQIYRTGRLTVAGRSWNYKIGSITYPDRRRGWVSSLFIHAAAVIRTDPRRWLTVLVTDETQQPVAKELAGILKTALAGISARPAAPAGKDRRPLMPGGQSHH